MPLALTGRVALSCWVSRASCDYTAVLAKRFHRLAGACVKRASPSPLPGKPHQALFNTRTAAQTYRSHSCWFRSFATSRSGNPPAAMPPSDAEPVHADWPLAAVATMTSVGDQDANFATCERLVKEAKAKNAAMLFLPECCVFIGRSQQETVSKAQPLDGPLMKRFQQLACDNQIWLSLGGFQEVGPDPEHMYNSHIIIGSDGQIQATYRKVHLFNVDVPNGPVLMESRSTAPGNQLVACDSPIGRLGVTICYDLRFPEVYQQLTFQHGAQILLMPSAFTKVTGEAHWELLLRTRAVECQCYVIAAAQAGRHNEKRESYGHSLIIDPWGKIVGRQEDPLATGIAVAPIDLSYLDSVRVRMPMADHRRQGRQCLGWEQ